MTDNLEIELEQDRQGLELEFEYDGHLYCLRQLTGREMVELVENAVRDGVAPVDDAFVDYTTEWMHDRGLVEILDAEDEDDEE